MTPVARSNPLASMLDNAFKKFDQNKDGKLNSTEYQSFYEVLRPGIATNDNKPVVGVQESMARIDANADGGVSREEVQNAGVLMPAELTDESLDAMLQHLLEQSTYSAQAAAQILAKEDEPVEGAAGV